VPKNASGERPAGQQRIWARLARHRALIVSYLQAFSGQLGLSLFNFCLNVFLVRVLPPKEYGIFAFALVAGQVAMYVNGALVAAPLMVHAPACEPPAARLELETRLYALNTLIAVATFGVAFANGVVQYGEAGPGGLGVITAFALYVLTFMQRHLTRCAAYARQQPAIACVGDLGIIALGSLLLLAGWTVTGGFSVAFVLTVLATANACMSAVEMRRLGLRPMAPSRARIRGYGSLWLETRWALLGSTTTFVQSQAHSVIVSTAAGPAAFAPLAAGQVVIAPVGIAIFALQNAMVSRLSIAVSRSDRAAIRLIAVFMTLTLLAMVAGIGVLAFALWDFIWEALFQAKYSAYPMGWLVFGFWCVGLVRALYAAPSCLLVALREFKSLALASLFGGGVSLISVGVILLVAPFYWTAAGVLLGEMSFLVVLMALVAGRLGAVRK
jgi:O-antigen/teichoic acid export membrane protein